MTDVPPIFEFGDGAKKPSFTIKKELHDSAVDLMRNQAFRKAIMELRKRWFAELIENGGGDLTGARLCAMIKALELIPAELNAIINDFKHG